MYLPSQSDCLYRGGTGKSSADMLLAHTTTLDFAQNWYSEVTGIASLQDE